MLMPPRSTAPFMRGMPERILPVCPGWMPTPTAGRLKRPWMTLRRLRKGASGSRVLLSSI